MKRNEIGCNKLARKIAALAGIKHRTDEVVKKLTTARTLASLEKLEDQIVSSNNPHVMARKIIYRNTGILSTIDILKTLNN